MPPSERFSEETLREALKSSAFGHPLFYFQSIGSTNDFAKEAASAGAAEGTLVVSEEQTEGRGRVGKKWASAPGSGVWMSLILRPDLPPAAAAKITLLVAVAVVAAIEETTGLRAGIKWPNDIIINGRKACGILTEMGTGADGKRHVIVGIGINVNTGRFPRELENKATSLKQCLGREVSRKEVLIRTILELERIYFDFTAGKIPEKILRAYRKNSVTIGRRIGIIGKNKVFSAVAVDVNDEGELLVRKDDGEMKLVRSGEVSIRPAGE